jgi:hypothetical protein
MRFHVMFLVVARGQRCWAVSVDLNILLPLATELYLSPTLESWYADSHVYHVGKERKINPETTNTVTFKLSTSLASSS